MPMMALSNKINLTAYAVPQKHSPNHLIWCIRESLTPIFPSRQLSVFCYGRFQQLQFLGADTLNVMGAAVATGSKHDKP